MDNAQLVESERGEGRGEEVGAADYARMTQVLDLVAAERVRQRHLLRVGRLMEDLSNPKTTDGAASRIIGEEYGEVCNASNELAELRLRFPVTARLQSREQLLRDCLKTELIQLAACAVARVEAMLQQEALQP